MAYWLFKYDPLKFNFKALAASRGRELNWRVTRFRKEMTPGDIVFVWCGGKTQAVVAWLRIIDSPKLMPESENDQRYWTSGRDTELRMRVVCTIEHCDRRIGRNVLRETPGLEGLCLFHGWQQATNFRVHAAEGEILMKLWETAEPVAGEQSSGAAPPNGS